MGSIFKFEPDINGGYVSNYFHRTPVIPKVPRYFISNGVTKDETLSDEEKFTTPPSTPKIRQPDMSFDKV